MGSTGGGQFGQNSQKLHENDKIDIFGSKQWGDMGGGQANFSGSGGGFPPHFFGIYFHVGIFKPHHYNIRLLSKLF